MNFHCIMKRLLKFDSLIPHLFQLSSSLINSLIFSATCWSLPADNGSSHSLIPTFQSSATNFLLLNWSCATGLQIIGTPHHTLSTVEFYPLCVMNPPTAGFERTRIWLHHRMINPLSPISSWNPSGSIWSLSRPVSRIPDRMAQMKFTPLRRSPYAISSITFLLVWAKLPNETYRTEPGGLESSQWSQSDSDHKLLVTVSVGRFLEKK